MDKYTHSFIPYIVICIMVLFISDLFATPSVFEAIKRVEAIDKTVPNEFIKRPDVTYKAEGLSDPFKPCIAEEEPPVATGQSSAVFPNQEIEKPLPSLAVQGLVWGGNFPQAIINSKVLKIGDAIEGARIKEIGKDGITLIFEGREHRLPVTASKNSPYYKFISSGGEYEKKF